MPVILVPVLCACSWYGELPSTAACPKCQRSDHDRVTPCRIEALHKIKAYAGATLPPLLRDRLIQIGLVVQAGTIPRGDGSPKPAHQLTKLGEAVLLENARRLEARRRPSAGT